MNYLKVQYLHPLYSCATKWSTILAELSKSAISAPTFPTGPPNGPLYRLTSKKCNSCTHFTLGPPNGPLYWLNSQKVQFLHPLYCWHKKCNFFWHIFTGSHQIVLCTGRVRKTVILVTTLTVGYQMFPNTSWLMKMHILAQLCNWATRWRIHNLTGPPYRLACWKVPFCTLL